MPVFASDFEVAVDPARGLGDVNGSGETFGGTHRVTRQRSTTSLAMLSQWLRMEMAKGLGKMAMGRLQSRARSNVRTFALTPKPLMSRSCLKPDLAPAVPELSLMQFADLGQECRRDFVRGASGAANVETQNVKNATGIKRPLCLDESDAEDFGEQDGDYQNTTRDDDLFFDCLDEADWASTELDATVVDGDALGQASLPFTEVKKRRVSGKTLAVATVGLPLNPQITKKEQRLLRGASRV